MATIRKKLCVEAISRWQRSTNMFVIMISVTHEDGSPVTNLTNSNFKAGRYAGGDSWDSFNINGTVNTEANSHGFYSYLHGVALSDSAAVESFWFSHRQFTLEVTKEINKGDNGTIFHGQCIVPMDSTEVYSDVQLSTVSI